MGYSEYISTCLNHVFDKNIYIYIHYGSSLRNFVNQNWLVSEGHFIRFTKGLSENIEDTAGLRTQYEIPKSGIRNNYFDKAKISEIEEKNILPCNLRRFIYQQQLFSQGIFRMFAQLKKFIAVEVWYAPDFSASESFVQF